MPVEVFSNSSLYTLFGVNQLAQQLQQAGKQQELWQLEATVSEFILLKSLEELTPPQKADLKKANIRSAQEMYEYFSAHIENYQERLSIYGEEFQRTIQQSK